MEVRWSIPAAEDLERICEWIERDNPEAARRVARTIYDGCARLRCERHNSIWNQAAPVLLFVGISTPDSRTRELGKT